MARPKAQYHPIAPIDLAGQLRAAVKASGKSQYRLHRETGISQSAISAFLKGRDELKLSTAAALAAAVGLQFAPASAGRRPSQNSPDPARSPRTAGRSAR